MCAYITDEYLIGYKGKNVACYEVMSDGRCMFYPYQGLSDEQKEAMNAVGIGVKTLERKRPIKAVAALMKDEYRVPGIRGKVFVCGDWRVERIPQETEEVFTVYRHNAEKGEPWYSEKDHSAPHCEGSGPIEGMSEWCTWYLFRRMDDGTYQAELDESWWWGGGHNDGGTIRTPVPEEWFALGWDEFLENLVRLSAAAHYGFTPEDLKEREGLREFFGY